MIRAKLFFVILVLFAASIYSQSNKPFSAGTWEMNLSGSMGSLNYSNTYSSTYSSTSHSESHTYLQLSGSPAVYVADGFSIEPELNVFLLQKSNPSFSVLLNASYTYRLDDSNIALFVRGGYGLSNSFQFPLYGGLMSRVSNKFDVPILNAGAGLKFILTDDLLLRTEINYRSLKYSSEKSSYGYHSKSETKYSFVSIFLGFSVLI